MSDLEQALAWMQANGRGYKAAAKEFSVSVSALRAAKGARTTPKQAPEGVGREAWLRRALRETEKDVQGAREDHSWQAVAGLRRCANGFSAELDALEQAKANADPDGDLSDDELLAVLEESIRAFRQGAPAHFERIAAVVDALRGPPQLEVVGE